MIVILMLMVAWNLSATFAPTDHDASAVRSAFALPDQFPISIGSDCDDDNIVTISTRRPRTIMNGERLGAKASQPEVCMSRFRSIALAGAAACLMALRPGGALAADLSPVGSSAPNFTLTSQEDKQVSLSDYKDKWVVVYFYPKDQTSGCTLEAHNFQRDLPKYQTLNAVVLGVSLDTVESHKTFCTKDSLTFKLLADPDHKVVDAYGVPLHSFGTMHYAERTTFLIAPDGKIVKEWKVKDIQSHSADILAAIQSLSK
jgi:peroxiredoxin Q/BCP